jgi:hypothetical protein
LTYPDIELKTQVEVYLGNRLCSIVFPVGWLGRFSDQVLQLKGTRRYERVGNSYNILNTFFIQSLVYLHPIPSFVSGNVATSHEA